MKKRNVCRTYEFFYIAVNNATKTQLSLTVWLLIEFSLSQSVQSAFGQEHKRKTQQKNKNLYKKTSIWYSIKTTIRNKKIHEIKTHIHTDKCKWMFDGNDLTINKCHSQRITLYVFFQEWVHMVNYSRCLWSYRLFAVRFDTFRSWFSFLSFFLFVSFNRWIDGWSNLKLIKQRRTTQFKFCSHNFITL